jgi:ABC-2 type transport system permease protein
VPSWGAKTVSVFVLGLGSMLTLWLATSLVFRAPWGDPLAVLVLCLATVFSIAGLSALVTSLVRTEAQAEGYTSMLTFTLAILGGNFVAPGSLPEALRRLSLLTPNEWALRTFTDLSSGGVVLAAIVVSGAVALVLLQRLVRS